MLLVHVHPCAGLVPFFVGNQRASRQQLTCPTRSCCGSHRSTLAREYCVPLRNFGRRSKLVVAFAPQSVGQCNGAWDESELGAALQVPPPTARAFGAALRDAGHLPPRIKLQDVATRCGILQQDLGLTSVQVVRMLSLQPRLLACPTATLRACAMQLAAGLSTDPTAAPNTVSRRTRGASTHPTSPASPSIPDPARDAGRPVPANTATARAAATVSISPDTRSPSPELIRPVSRGTRGQHMEAATAVTPPTGANSNLSQPPQTPLTPSHSPKSSTDSNSGGEISAPCAISAAEAIALIARQPALLGVSPGRLCTRCRELARLLDSTPYDACMCITRLRPHELDQMLQASRQQVRAAWLGLAAALASLEQPGWPQAAPPPVVAASPALAADSNGVGEDGGGGRLGDERGQGLLQGQGQEQQQQRMAQCIPPPPSPSLLTLRPHGPRISSRGADLATQRMVQLCPSLLFMPPREVRASALHLRALLRLPPAGLRRLLVRSPRLLLLPPRHRAETMRALSTELALRHPHDAARLVAQQPNLLKWTPEALREKMAEMAAALGLSYGDVARLCRNQPALLAMSADSLACKLRHLQDALALPDAEAARRLVLRQPGVLAASSDAVTRKLHEFARGLWLLQRNSKPSRACASAGPAQVGSSKRAKEGHESGLAEVRRLMVAEPTLITMNASATSSQIAMLAEALRARTVLQARDAVLACPRLLVLQRDALRHQLRELTWALEAPAAAVQALVLAHPGVLFAPLARVRAAVEAAEAAGVGEGLHDGKLRRGVVLKHLALDKGWEA